MANIKFLIRQPEQESPQTIYISYRFGRNDKLCYATPLKVEALFWDAERMKVKVSRYCRYTDEVNSALTAIGTLLEHYINDAARDGLPISKDTLKGVLDEHFNKRNSTEDFHSFFKYYVQLCDTRVNEKRGGQTISYNGKRQYARTLYYIEEYEKSRKRHLEFDNIDINFYEDFIAFLKTRNLSTNTIGNKITFLKAMMEAAYKRGLTTNMKYKSFHRITEDSESVALSEEELHRVSACNLKRHPKVARVRDLFLVGCWTGLRFSDLARIRPENITENMISLRQQKTDRPVVIPVHPEFRRIWDSYGGKLPRVISNQKFNEYVKEVCKAARLRTKVQKSITRGGKRITTIYEKWQIVSSHTARRSFATNLYKSGFPSISIMAITGHKSEAAFLKYIKVSKEEHAKLLAQHWKEKGNV